MTLRPRLLLAATLAVEAAIAAVVVVISVAGDSGAPAAPDREGPFYLEALAVVEGRDPPRRAETNIRIWFADERHYRQEFVSTTSDHGDHSTTRLADGEYLWIDVNDAPTYQRLSLAEVPISGRYLGLSALLWPLPFTNIDQLLSNLISIGGSTTRDQRFARVAGRERILGIDTTIIEHGPTWSSARATLASPGSPPGPTIEESGGVALTWVDPRTMFALRHESDLGEGGRALVQVTRLDWSPHFADGTFRFSPPPNKPLSTATATSGFVVPATPTANQPP